MYIVVCFTSLFKVFQSYWDDDRMIKICLWCNPVYSMKNSLYTGFKSSNMCTITKHLSVFPRLLNIHKKKREKQRHIVHILRFFTVIKKSDGEFGFTGLSMQYKRGTVVEWLEQLGYGAESRRIAWVRGSAVPCGDRKTLSVNPAENGYLFRIREG